MPRYFAFLRAINVGGHVVRMETLRELFTSLGLSGVETFIASGNVVFESRTAKPAALEARIARHLEASLGYPVATFLRTEAELAAIHGHRPFDDAEIQAAGAFCVGFLARALTDVENATLLSLQTDLDTLRANGREVYWLCRTRQSDSKITNGLLERSLRYRLRSAIPPRSPS